MSIVEDAYREAVDAMTPAEKFRRVEGLNRWIRELYAQQILDEKGAMSDELLKWQVALRIYGNQPKTRALIEAEIERVSN